MTAKIKIIFLSIILFTITLNCIAQISISSLSTPFTQNFNTLATTGTTNANTTIPAGWAFVETGTNANTTYSAGTGSSATGDTYSFGAASNTERSFGTQRSGTVVPTIGAQFSNATGATITQLDISYVGEQWRLGTTGRTDRLDFQYSLDATSLTTGTWTDFNSLDFNAPISAGTAGILDGNLTANRIAINSSITSLSLANGSTFWIRWTDFDATSSDDGLGIDDFSITAIGGAVVLTPEINLKGNATTIADGDVTPSTTDHTDFGSTCEVSGTITRTYTIENTGTSDLTITAINLSGTNAADFTIGGITLPAAIAASSSTTFTVTFDPSASGTRTATISITNDDSNEATYDFAIQGTGTTSALTTSSITGSPFCLDPDAAVSVPFTSTCITFTGGNVFTAQLSNSTGSFASPTTIGTLTSTSTSGTISATIPASTPTGTGYRIRVVSSSPGFTAANNGTDLSITSAPCALQVPYITAVLVNSCDGSCTEGQNEIVFLNSGDYSIPVSPANIIVKYESNSPATVTYTDAFVSNASYITRLNDSAGCGVLFIDALTAGTIPANSPFLLMRFNPCYGYDFTAYCGSGPIYVLFSNDGSWTTSGNFVNSDNTNPTERYFRTDFTATIPSSVIDYSYDGSVIVNADGAGVTYDGTGGEPASYFYNNNCTPPPLVLPIELVKFSAVAKPQSVKLSWSTASEVNNDYFTIMRSSDGIYFTDLLKVEGKGNSTKLNNYMAIDYSPLNGISYYKLKQTDFDGTSSESEVVAVNFDEQNAGVSISQNDDYLFIKHSDDVAGTLNISLYNIAGQKLQEELFPSQGVSKLKKPKAKGIYILNVITDHSKSSSKIIIQ